MSNVAEVSDEVLAGYFDFASVSGSNEEIPDELESPEVGVRKAWTPTLPGKYISSSRILVAKDGFKARLRADGHYGFQFQFTSGLLDPKTKDVHDTRFPLKLYIDTKPRELSDWENGVRKPRLDKNGQPLMQSAVASYLRKFRNEDGTAVFNPKTKSLKDIAGMVEESLNLPVGVVVGWREKTPKNPDGTYIQNYKYRTKAKDYLVEGVYTPTITLADGSTFTATNYVLDFCAVSSVEGQG